VNLIACCSPKPWIEPVHAIPRVDTFGQLSRPQGIGVRSPGADVIGHDEHHV
jgi:hypothetical protein